MKVLILAFGNPDNVISLSGHLSEQVKLTLLFVVSGERFRQGAVDADISGIPLGLTTEQSVTKKILGSEIGNYSGDKYEIWLLKTLSRKFLFRKGGYRNLKIIKSASRLLSEFGFDAVHFNGTSGFLLYFLHFLKCGKKFWTLHDYKSHSGEENKTGDFLNRLYTRYKMMFIQHYKYLSVEFVKYFGVKDSRVRQVYSGEFDIYRSFTPKKIDVPAKYILFFGRFSKYKGISILVNAYSEAEKRLNGTELVLAGSGDTGLDIKTDSGIKLINRYIEAAELVYLIQQSMFVVTPYTDSTHSGVIMTALVFNKPVISADVGGIREVIRNGETGMLFSPGDSGKLAECIARMCGDEQLREKMSENIADMKLRGILNWKSISEQMSGIYSGKG